MSPPLRKEDDRLAVIEGIQDGTIDAIASDHRARSKDTKAQPFSAASVGASGIETLFLMKSIHFSNPYCFSCKA